MIRRPPRSTLSSSSAASDVYKRQAQVAPHDIADPDEVLVEDRLVESEQLVELGAVAGAVAGAEDNGGRVTRQEVDEVEAADRDDEDYADQHHQTSYDVFQHSFPSATC